MNLQSNRSPRSIRAAIRRSLLAAAVVAASLPMAQVQAAEEGEDIELQEVVVTGTLIRRTDAETTSPVTVITAEDLDKRGKTTVQDALLSLASNNGPAITNSWTAQGNFAAGATAVSLRGLTTSSTLVLFDGLRAAYYPLADDGTRNFVDLNTIPDDIVERVEVLRDGASSAYGADAVAGVVNIITKKNFQGLSFRAEGGISEYGDAAQSRFSITAGKGDLAADGFNAYISAYYLDENALKNKDRPYPFDTDDLRNVCWEGTCGPNGIINGVNADGELEALGLSSAFMVRPYDSTNTTAQGPYQLLNGCGNLPSYTLTAADRIAVPTAPPVVCQEDVTKLYGFITPNVQRMGLSGRATVQLGDNMEAYAEMNFQQASVDYRYIPATIRANVPTGIAYAPYSTSASRPPYGNTILTLPVWVCPARVNCDTAADRQLNPNNPFAASNQVARLTGRLSDQLEYDETRNRVYRFATGVTGGVGEWNYDIGATVMHTDLRRLSDGYVYVQHLLDVIADGTYNFVNPASNSATINEYLTPVSVNENSSDLAQLQAVVSRPLMDLPGGPAQIAVGSTVYREAVYAPSANDDYNGPTERYFRKNAFGTVGNRTVVSGFTELDLPFTEMLGGNIAGRYDHYSSGQHSFSPKVGLKFKPIDMLAVRGTYSRGFRIPSFAEANALPTTGYVDATAAVFTDAYLATYGCSKATFATCPTYIRSYRYGSTTLATPTLKPEKSRNLTLGVIVEPIRELSLTVDYYRIKKTGAISPASNTAAIEAYYSGQPIPPGFNVIPDAPDVNNPTLQPRLAFVESNLINANAVLAEGLDFGANFETRVGPFKLTSSFDVTYILELSTTFPDGTKERYEGTLGNYNLTAGSGTPEWHGAWVNSLDYGKYSATLTTNYFGGYNLSAEDQGTVAGDCGMSSGFTPCDVKAYVTFDLVGSMAVTDKVTAYVDIMNLFDKLPPLDNATYGAHLYNPVQGGNGILGRYYRAGFKLNF